VEMMIPPDHSVIIGSFWSVITGIIRIILFGAVGNGRQNPVS